MSSQTTTIVPNAVYDALRQTAMGGPQDYLHRISSHSISFHNLVQALLKYFPGYHARDQLVTLVKTACSITYLLSLVLNKLEVNGSMLTNDYEMMRIQIERALNGDRLSRTLSEAVAFVNELRTESYYDTTRTSSSCPVTCTLPGALESCFDKIGIFQTNIASFARGLKLSSDPVQVVERILSLPGFTFILSGSDVLLRITQLDRDYHSMSELERRGEANMWSVCLFARGIAKVASKTSQPNNGSDLAQILVRSILRYKRTGYWENPNEVVETLNHLTPDRYRGWDRGLPSGFSSDSVHYSVQSLYAHLANQ
ncbi:hypothetical protein PQX77_020048 [Marasmius sp. AFHP31]|nr:hypothetical protein PQX77_020048 [Marasmius sp. AFHP31]